MIQLITGNKGTGKTKAIIDIANDHVDTAKGDIVFLTDTDRYMYSLRYQVRAMNTSALRRGTETTVREDLLVGYIYNGGNKYFTYYAFAPFSFEDVPKPYFEVEIEYNKLNGKPNKYLSIQRVDAVPSGAVPVTDEGRAEID